ncbi:hypothetical protein FKW77_002006 [Venturia effusa]|uniref:Uncharacterized protein n=1 Tax=Venturia effusa TaxID=50376 RepID=A0A517LMI4_9PEZI|nr:hypothetical protein FKW77_002006 [Venturia effusa]
MWIAILALSCLLSVALARIVGISVPKTIAPGEVSNAILLTEKYTQPVSDVAIAFGVAPGAGFPGNLGTTLKSLYLGPEKSNTLTNITVAIDPVPQSIALGAATLSATLYSLYGTSSSAVLTNFAVAVAIANVTSSEYVSSNGSF